MTSAQSAYGFQCRCGANRFRLQGAPAMRAICHCLNCQEYNQGAYGDFLVYRETQLESVQDTASVYRAFSKPPMVKRGTCTQCAQPVLERVNIPFFPKMIFVPVVNHPDQAALPQPVLQMFSHRKIKEPQGQVPSYSGYLGSEAPFLWKLIGALLKHRA